ncbi:MAG: sensor domain-containing diguanylate cyclase [Acidimicrobiales bacterium]
MVTPAAILEIGGAQIDAETPLDVIESISHGHAVAAFEYARRNGRGTASVVLVDDADSYWLEIYNLEVEFGCFVAVLVPADTADTTDVAQASHAPVRTTYELGATGTVVAIGPAFTAMLGWKEEEIVGKSSLDFIHPDDHEAGIVSWIELLGREHSSTRLRQRFKTSRGEWIWCEETNHNYLSDEPPVVVCEIVDVSREMAAHAALERREQLLERLSQALPTGFLYIEDDDEAPATLCNDQWKVLTGLDGEGGVEALISTLEDPTSAREATKRALGDGIDSDLDVTFAERLGECRYGTLHLRPMSTNGQHVGILITLDDVTRLRTYQLQLADQTRRDPLTGIYNRLGIEAALEASLAASRDDTEMAVLFIDLDRFKAINDSHGHAIGDHVLELVAKRIDDLLRADDAVGRIGGDEFLVVLGSATSLADAELVAERIQQAIPALADLIPADIELSASIGLARTQPNDDFDALLRRADGAMYEAKRAKALER